MAPPKWKWIVPCVAAWLLASCDDGTDLRPRTPDIRFLPQPGSLVVEACADVEFQVLHVDGEELSVEYWVNGELVQDLPSFLWAWIPPGSHRVRAVAHSAEGESRTGEWTVLAEGEPCAPEDGERKIQFFPLASDLEVEPFASTIFRAYHKLREDIEVAYFLDGRSVSDRPFFAWDSEFPSEHVMRATARLADGSAEAMEWRIRVTDQPSTPVPEVLSLTAERMEEVGHASLQWIRAHDKAIQVPISDYLVYSSTEPFVDTGAAGVTQRVVPDTRDERLHSVVVPDMEAGETNYIRVVTRDLLGRVSTPTPAVTVYVTGLFSIAGGCQQLVPETLRWIPAPGLRLSWLEQSTTSIEDGSFLLGALSDYDSGQLLLDDPAGILQPMRGGLFDSEAMGIDFFALPWIQYPMEIPEEGLHSVSLSRLLRLFSRTWTTTSQAARPLYRWEDYPVRVHALDFSYVGSQGEVVSYAPIIREAAELWNAAAQRPLFEVVDAEPELGVVVRVDLSPESGLLGETVITRPYRGNVYTRPPEEITLRLREYNYVSVAQRVILHELGHALLLGHSPDESHVMHASASQSSPSGVEASAAAFLSVLPQGIDMNRYRD